MLRFVRAGLAAAAIGLAMTAAIAADKPFKQVALEEAAIKLEAQIKGDAGVVNRRQRPCAAMPTRPSRKTTSEREC
jgi:alpha-2-macroglobulin